MRSTLLLLVVFIVPFLAFAEEQEAWVLPDSAHLPLRHTQFEVEVTGPHADVVVTQRFDNLHEKPIELLYVLPMPAQAAVHALEVRLGERVIEGKVLRREEATALYGAARDRGVFAGLVEQQRANVFSQRIANILPGETIDVQLRFTTPVKWVEGSWELALPTVVGQRYLGRDSKERLEQPPLVATPSMKERSRVGFRVYVEAGARVGQIESPSHDIDVSREGETAFEVAVTDALPNQDFVLRWNAETIDPEASIVAHAVDGKGTFLLQILPPVTGGQVSIPREVVMLLDTSGSMEGYPLQTAKAVGSEVLENLLPHDTFRILDFSDTTRSLADDPLPATRENIERGRKHLESLSSGGGTDMMAGVRAALRAHVDRGRLRTVLLLTDGYIGNENSVLAEVQQSLGGARIFSLGFGTSVNRFLLDELALVGRGAVDYVRPDEDTIELVARFRHRIERPVLTDISLQAPGIADLHPRRLPDLYDGQPIQVWGRYEKPGQRRFVVTGDIGGVPWVQEMEIDLPAHEPRRQALAMAWARARIGELSRLGMLRDTTEHVEEIVQLALTHQLVTSYTSLVAVEESTRTGEEPLKVAQPALAPAGTIFGGERRKVAVSGLLGPLGDGHQGEGLGSRGTGRSGGGSGLGLGGLGTRGGTSLERGIRLALSGNREEQVVSKPRPSNLVIEVRSLSAGHDVDSARNRLEKMRRALLQCHAPATDYERYGEMQFSLGLAVDGSVLKITLRRTNMDNRTAACAIEKLKSLRFAKTQTKASLDLLLRFGDAAEGAGVVP